MKGVEARARDTSVMKRNPEVQSAALTKHGGNNRITRGVRSALSHAERAKARRRVGYTRRKLFEVMPHLDYERDYFLVDLLASKLRQHEELTLWLESNGVVQPDGRVLDALSASDRITKSVMLLLDRLGASPAAALSLGLTVAQGKTQDLASQLMAARLERERQSPEVVE